MEDGQVIVCVELDAVSIRIRARTLTHTDQRDVSVFKSPETSFEICRAFDSCADATELKKNQENNRLTAMKKVHLLVDL